MERLREFSKNTIEIFFEAIKTRDWETIFLFLEAGMDPNIWNVNGWTPLTYVVRYGNKEIVSLLLDFGEDPNIRTTWGKTPLYYAEFYCYKEMVHLLRRHGAKYSDFC